jgi:hypothetical protein
VTLALANRVYANLDLGTVVVHRVAATRFRAFSSDVGVLSRTVSRDDLVGSAVVSWLKRLRFVLSAAPVPFNHPFAHCIDADQLDRMRIRLELGYGGHVETIKRVFAEIEAMRNDDDAPLWSAFESVLAQNEPGCRVAVLAADTSLFGCFEAHARSAASAIGLELSVMGQRGLGRWGPADVIITFGAPRLYKAFLFSAPYAPAIHVIQYGWITSPIPESPNPPQASITLRPIGRRVRLTGVKDAILEIQSEEVGGTWDELSGHAGPHHSGVEAEHALVEDGRLVRLSAGFSVFVPADREEHLIVIDDSDGVVTVRRITVGDLEPGMHMILRTEGAADYIQAVADARLGGRAPALRAVASAWKEKLRTLVDQQGLEEVAGTLRHAGLGYASRGSVERWSSSRNIGTKTRVAFAVLMHVIGAEDQTDTNWKNALALWAAHRSAGFAIRSMLLNVVRSSDLGQLKQYGRMDFALDVAGAGTLTAFTVEEISPKVRPVHSTQIGRPFPTTYQMQWLD